MIYKGNISHNEAIGMSSITKLIKTTAVAAGLSMFFICIPALVVTLTDVPESIIPPTVNIIRLFTILLSAIFMTFGTTTRGWLKGLVAGVSFSAVMFLLGVAFIENYFDAASPLKLFAEGSLVGMTGGIIGINLKRNKKR